MDFPDPNQIATDTGHIAVYEAGPKDGVPVLMIHGWPELAYSWKGQLPALAQAGYRAIAMDVRGFGHSSAPIAVSDYHITEIVKDVRAVLDGLDIETVVLVGHDWGGIIVWHAARMIAKRIDGVISICTPHMRTPPADPIEIFKRRHGKDHYFVRFQEPDAAEALFSQNPLWFFKAMFRRTPKTAKPSHEMFYLMNRVQAFFDAGAQDTDDQVMSNADLQVFADAYARSGFHGGINLYRNTTANWHYDQTLPEEITQPSLMLSADRDLFLPPAMSDPMLDMVADLERKIIKDCGHWAMWEQPEALNAAMLDWLGRKF